MTGISDIVRGARGLQRTVFRSRYAKRIISFLPQSLRIFVERLVIGSSNVCESIPQPQYSFFEERFRAKTEDPVSNRLEVENGRTEGPLKWGLLLPVCCRNTDGGEVCLSRVQELVTSLDRTTSMVDRESLKIVIGIDQDDIFFDKDETKQRMVAIFADINIKAHQVSFVMLRPHFRGKLCKIWEMLALKAKGLGCDFFVLIGDDVTFLEDGWKNEIEQQFHEISVLRKLPFGVACVAFRDMAFPVFPTFPVIHSLHLEIFGCLFPIEFINQHGDPFLFELYRRLGASEFASRASLNNTIGGATSARYEKHSFRWQDSILSTAITKLLKYVGRDDDEQWLCLNVVVPTYRCDVSLLRNIRDLRCTVPNTSLHFLFVVDNPGSRHVSSVEALKDWTSNHLVRVYVNPTNMGASLSRNTGLACSFGDWVVLLDDDVVPHSELLDAYAGAILRNPQAKILVGATKLPEPKLFMQHVLVTSRITFFYDIASRMRNPPWGVTANLCVEGRTNDRIWFSSEYPRTGGGEDVDFCLRMKDLQPYHCRNEVIVAVPEAAVEHPFWSDISKQVMGWAHGDVRCLSALPLRTFYALPNWIEFILFYFAFCPNSCGHDHISRTLKVVTFVVLFEVILGGKVAFPRVPRHFGLMKRLILALCASYPLMLQDVARLISKVRRLRLTHLCLHLDWMDGQGEHVTAILMGQFLKFLAFLAVSSALELAFSGPNMWLIVYLPLSFFLTLIFLGWNSSDESGPDGDDKLSSMQSLSIPHDSCVQPFVVLAQQRTGSNLFCGRLHNHSQIVMHSEIFNKAKILSYHNKELEADSDWHWDIFQRDLDPIGFLNDMYAFRPCNKPQCVSVGFKLFPDQWTRSNTPAFRQLLADRSVKKIFLTRANPLAVYVSKLRADKSGAYLRENLDSVKLELDPKAFGQFLEYYDSCNDFMERMIKGQDVLRLSYEELTDGESSVTVMKSVLAFLGVRNTNVPAPLSITVKQSLEPLSEAIINYQEIVSAFRLHPRMRPFLNQQ